ncbi:MAG: hypothetical protein LLG37_09970 [Spirochaetia bacterium]|nr:hypothetical protein [Spirochaetia bacterium]
MVKKEDRRTALKENENFEGFETGREHLELLRKARNLKSFETPEARTTVAKIDSLLVKLYLSL